MARTAGTQNERTAAEWETLIAASVILAKGQILDSFNDGSIPREAIRTFADLHDYCDANEFGGLCENGWIESTPEGDITEATMNAANRVQDLVNEWIEAGFPAPAPAAPATV